jgi:hypothetical protein
MTQKLLKKAIIQALARTETRRILNLRKVVMKS